MLQSLAGNRAVALLLASAGSKHSVAVQRHAGFRANKGQLESAELKDAGLQLAASSASQALEHGKSSGPSVTRLQTALANAGHPVTASSDQYDDATRQAVAAFQVEHGIPFPTGLQAGPKTLSTLDDHLRGGSSPVPERVPCNYEPGEKAASASSDGAVEIINDREFLLTDFAPGSAALKPAHKRLLTKLVADFQLTNPFADDVLNVTGNTDCVSEDVVADTRLRSARAKAVVTFLDFFNTLDGRTSAAQDPLGQISGGNETRIGRARNRHARISMTKLPPDTPEQPKKKESPPGQRPVPAVQTFLVRVTGGVSGGEIVAADFIQLRVVDLDQGLEADYTYTGLGVGAGLAPVNRVSPGQFTKVSVDHVTAGGIATLQSFAGTAGLLSTGGGEASVAVLDVARGFGTINLDGVSLVPGTSGTVGVIQMRGDPGRFDPKSVDPDPGGA